MGNVGYWFRRTSAYAVCILLLHLVFATPVQAQSGEITYFPCPFDTQGLVVKVDCGWVSVPLHADRGTSETVQIVFAQIHSLSNQPVNDPLLYMDGGPGGETVKHIPFTIRPFQSLLETRDLVFFDQRGAGLSRPSLDCPQLTAEIVEVLHSPSVGTISTEQAQAQSVLRDCRAGLTGQGIDFSAYTSRAMASDSQYLMRALGYRQWNLYSISYGTRLALTVLRDDPQGVRAVILDSPAPPNVDLIVEGVSAVPHAYLNLFSQCQQDLLCRLGYPDLQEAYQSLVQRLALQPRSIQLNNGETLTLDGAHFRAAVSLMLSHPQFRWMIPSVVSEVQDGGDSSIRGFYDILNQSKSEGRQSYSLAFNVLCYEEAPFTDPQALNDAVNSALSAGFDPGITSGIYSICEQWGMGQPDPQEQLAVFSDRPVLIFSGAYDLNTPPEYAALALQTLPHGQLVSFPAVGHGVIQSGDCPVALMSSIP